MQRNQGVKSENKLEQHTISVKKYGTPRRFVAVRTAQTPKSVIAADNWKFREKIIIRKLTKAPKLRFIKPVGKSIERTHSEQRPAQPKWWPNKKIE